MTANLSLDPLDEVLADYKAGKMVIIVDDAHRENEGDIAVASEAVTTEQLAFMMREARGLICVSIGQDRAEALGLPLETQDNRSLFGTAFTISVDSTEVAAEGVTSAGRQKTILKLLAKDAERADFMTPGHIFPLIAHPDGVLGRRGQTEGSLDLARMAGLEASGVICEILNKDGTMARGDALRAFAKEFNLKITSIEAIAESRRMEGMQAEV